tara:strand:+ start:1168 stop:1545 length:378 start_codon:yes stop_codon:yes gene_type:complete
MNFIERVISNYFLAWNQIFNYTNETGRIPFWHFFIVDGLIGTFISIASTNSYSVEQNSLYEISNSFDWSYLYSIPSFLVFIALTVRRLRDIGKENLFLWVLLSFIPFYNIYIFSQPSADKSISEN